MPIPFHPLADLFPLIEGAEFDELVASIKANGLREEIVMFDGLILDGRNRYLACGKAGVEPRFKTFTGSDPYAYVADMNIHRRHLEPSQRAMIAARMTTLSRGQRADYADVSTDTSALTPAITVEKAAEIMGVSTPSVKRARLILSEGTQEEIQSVESGKIGLVGLSTKMRAKKNREPIKLSDKGKNPERLERMRERAQIWGHLRDALTNLTSLPHPVDVAQIARANDKSHTIETKLVRAINYLTEFSDAWNNDQNRQNSSRDHAHAPDADGDGDAGNGDRASGAERPQQAAE